MRIIEACTQAEIAAVRTLFEEYWASFGFTPCFQGFAEEVASLPGKYASIGLLLIDHEAAGCAALRPLDETRVEFKRLYIRPQFRGRNLGQFLLDWVIGRA